MLSEQRYKQRISLGQSGNSLVILIAIHLIMFVLLGFLRMVYHFRYDDNAVALKFFNKNVLSWFTLPADFDKMMSQPWSLLTYMFIHISFWQILANMLWLWSFGFIMQDLTGNKKIIPIFLYGSVLGGLAFILAYNIVPGLRPSIPLASLMGASPGIMAIAVSTTMVAPTYRIFPMIRGGFPLWILAAVYVVIDLVLISLTDMGVFASHVTGAAAGFVFMFFLRKGYDGSEWINSFFDWINNLFNPDRPRKGKNTKEELFYKASTPPYKKTPNVTQQRVDEILDKINQKGYHFLTDDEKELLRKASKEDL